MVLGQQRSASGQSAPYLLPRQVRDVIAAMNQLKLIEGRPYLLEPSIIAPFCNESESADATTPSP